MISSQSNINFTCIELSENKPQLVPKLNWEKESQKGNLPYHYFLVIGPMVINQQSRAKLQNKEILFSIDMEHVMYLESIIYNLREELKKWKEQNKHLKSENENLLLLIK